MDKPENSAFFSGVAHAVIPARYASTRFPGKPLTVLCGRPMFWHVYTRAASCPALSSVTLATDDQRIFDAAVELGVPVLMTGSGHESGTDRVHEAAQKLGFSSDAVVVNVQGDEPALDPSVITELLGAFADPGVSVATLAHPLSPGPAPNGDSPALPPDLSRPDKVKVVLAANGDALYFSRAGIPFPREGRFAHPALGHIGMYAFTMRALSRFVSLAPSPLELTEKLEQLRFLENGMPVRVVLTDKLFPGVDKPEDVGLVLPLLQ